MPENQRRVYPPAGDGEVTQASSENGVIRRRDFIRTGASGLAGAALAAAGCSRASESQSEEVSCSPSTPGWETSRRPTF